MARATHTKIKTNLISMREIAIYVDGESHFQRSESYLSAYFQQQTYFDDIYEHIGLSDWGSSFGAVWGFDRKSRFYWDNQIHWGVGLRMVDRDNYRIRRVYFTSVIGSPEDFHFARTLIRSFGFEPEVIKEPMKQAERRENRLRDAGLIEKPKGVDIALSVRMLADAHNDLFDTCYLFTSDADFIPLIKAVRRMGKDVYVVGFRENLEVHSPFEYVPDGFFDYGPMVVNNRYRRKDQMPADQ
jgi:uncharacterized LabA/DUF88 family protein